MAYANINLEKNGKSISAPVGFSWTVLFFSWLVPIFRKDKKSFVIMLLASLFTLGISTIYFSFVYNNMYSKNLIKSGYNIKGVSELYGNEKSVEDLNPLNYNQDLGKYYIWVNQLNVKYMKYFDNKEQILEFIKSNPRKVQKLRFLSLTLKNNQLIPKEIKEKYAFPFESWSLAKI